VGYYSYGVGGQTDPDGYQKMEAPTGVSWNFPITVWRNNSYTPVFDSAYLYALQPRAAGGAVGVDVGSATHRALAQRSGVMDAASQKLRITASGSAWKIALKANAAKCFDLANGGTAPGTQVAIADCNGSTSQNWTVTPDVQTGAFMFRNVKAGRCLDA